MWPHLGDLPLAIRKEAAPALPTHPHPHTLVIALTSSFSPSDTFLPRAARYALSSSCSRSSISRWMRSASRLALQGGRRGGEIEGIQGIQGSAG